MVMVMSMDSTIRSNQEIIDVSNNNNNNHSSPIPMDSTCPTSLPETLNQDERARNDILIADDLSTADSASPQRIATVAADFANDDSVANGENKSSGDQVAMSTNSDEEEQQQQQQQRKQMSIDEDEDDDDAQQQSPTDNQLPSSNLELQIHQPQASRSALQTRDPLGGDSLVARMRDIVEGGTKARKKSSSCESLNNNQNAENSSNSKASIDSTGQDQQQAKIAKTSKHHQCQHHHHHHHNHHHQQHQHRSSVGGSSSQPQPHHHHHHHHHHSHGNHPHSSHHHHQLDHQHQHQHRHHNHHRHHHHHHQQHQHHHHAKQTSPDKRQSISSEVKGDQPQLIGGVEQKSMIANIPTGSEPTTKQQAATTTTTSANQSIASTSSVSSATTTPAHKKDPIIGSSEPAPQQQQQQQQQEVSIATGEEASRCPIHSQSHQKHHHHHSSHHHHHHHGHQHAQHHYHHRHHNHHHHRSHKRRLVVDSSNEAVPENPQQLECSVSKPLQDISGQANVAGETEIVTHEAHYCPYHGHTHEHRCPIHSRHQHGHASRHHHHHGHHASQAHIGPGDSQPSLEPEKQQAERHGHHQHAHPRHHHHHHHHQPHSHHSHHHHQHGGRQQRQTSKASAGSANRSSSKTNLEDQSNDRQVSHGNLDPDTLINSRKMSNDKLKDQDPMATVLRRPSKQMTSFKDNNDQVVKMDMSPSNETMGLKSSPKSEQPSNDNCMGQKMNQSSNSIEINASSRLDQQIRSPSMKGDNIIDARGSNEMNGVQSTLTDASKQLIRQASSSREGSKKSQSGAGVVGMAGSGKSYGGSSNVPIGGNGDERTPNQNEIKRKSNETEAKQNQQQQVSQPKQIIESAVPSDRRCRLCWCCCCPCSALSNRNQSSAVIKSEPTKQTASDSPNMSNNNKCQVPPNVSLEDIRAWGESFDRLMKCTEGRKIFQDFLRCEYSEENILFWIACEELKNERDAKSIATKARDIYEDYISILSAKEVSLDSRVRDVINNNIKKPTSNIFDEAQLQIYTLMHRDSYPRFINSPMYKKLAQIQTTSRKSSS